MTVEVLLRDENGNEKKGYVGFSWALLFFGPLALLWRRDFEGLIRKVYLYFIVYGLIILGILSLLLMDVPPHVSFYLSHNIGLYYGYHLGLLVSRFGIIHLSLYFTLIFAFVYNKYYTQRLIEKGYRPINEEGEKLLKSHKIDIEKTRGILLRNEKTKETRTVRFGFSTPVLIFGLLEPLLEGEFLILVINILIFLMFSHAIDSEGLFIVYLIIHRIVLSFCYNTLRIESLVGKGFRPIDEKGEKLLKKYKINY